LNELEIARQAAIGASWYQNERDRKSYTKNCSRAYLSAFYKSRGYKYTPSKEVEYNFIGNLFLVVREPIVLYRDRGHVLLWSDKIVYLTSKIGERIDEGDYLLKYYWEGF
jgi:hypothetical protein